MNLVTESEYNAAWNQGHGDDGWEYVYYGYYDNGYRYLSTQGQQLPDSNKHYSMMFTKRCKLITTGPKYFLVEMRNDDDDDEDTDDEEICDSDMREPNSKCKCTDKQMVNLLPKQTLNSMWGSMIIQ